MISLSLSGLAPAISAICKEKGTVSHARGFKEITQEFHVEFCRCFAVFQVKHTAVESIRASYLIANFGRKDTKYL